jgi:hypothetical protein
MGLSLIAIMLLIGLLILKIRVMEKSEHPRQP